MAASFIASASKIRARLPSIARASPGRLYERAALAYCRRRRYRVLHRNFRLAGGELDLIVCEKSGRWVVLEVRGRAKARYGARYRFPQSKARQLKRLSAVLSRMRKRSVRIELVEVTGPLPRALWRQWLLAYFPEWMGLTLRSYRLDE